MGVTDLLFFRNGRIPEEEEKNEHSMFITFITNIIYCAQCCTCSVPHGCKHSWKTPPRKSHKNLIHFLNLINLLNRGTATLQLVCPELLTGLYFSLAITDHVLTCAGRLLFLVFKQSTRHNSRWNV